MMLTLIVAADLDDCIGKAGEIPWYLPSDLRRFKELTTGHACILGSTTHDSIVKRLGHPLPNRRSYVLSRSKTGAFPEGMFVRDPELAVTEIDRALRDSSKSDVFVLGGSQIYGAFLPQVSKILLTRVHTRVNGDTFMPPNWLAGFMQLDSFPATKDPKDEYESHYNTYVRYERASHG